MSVRKSICSSVSYVCYGVAITITQLDVKHFIDVQLICGFFCRIYYILIKLALSDISQEPT